MLHDLSVSWIIDRSHLKGTHPLRDVYHRNYGFDFPKLYVTNGIHPPGRKDFRR